MNKFFAIFLATAASFSLSALASPSYSSCSNGDINSMGDRLFVVDIYEDGLEFSPYETSFGFDATEVNYSDNTFTIVNRVTSVSTEGEVSKTLINAFLLLNPKNNKLQVAISYDKGPFQSYELTCVKK